jgi:hypothetical protein
MSLESVLASLTADVSAVSGAQATAGAPLGCNVARERAVSAVSRKRDSDRFDTSETPDRSLPYHREPAAGAGRTPDTGATAETGHAQTCDDISGVSLARELIGSWKVPSLDESMIVGSRCPVLPSETRTRDVVRFRLRADDGHLLPGFSVECPGPGETRAQCIARLQQEFGKRLVMSPSVGRDPKTGSHDRASLSDSGDQR